MSATRPTWHFWPALLVHTLPFGLTKMYLRDTTTAPSRILNLLRPPLRPHPTDEKSSFLPLAASCPASWTARSWLCRSRPFARRVRRSEAATGSRRRAAHFVAVRPSSWRKREAPDSFAEICGVISWMLRRGRRSVS